MSHSLSIGGVFACYSHGYYILLFLLFYSASSRIDSLLEWPEHNSCGTPRRQLPSSVEKGFLIYLMVQCGCSLLACAWSFEIQMPAIFQPHPLLGPQNSPHSASGWGEKGKNQKWEGFVVFKESGDVHIPGQDCVSMPGGWKCRLRVVLQFSPKFLSPTFSLLPQSLKGWGTHCFLRQLIPLMEIWGYSVTPCCGSQFVVDAVLQQITDHINSLLPCAVWRWWRSCWCWFSGLWQSLTKWT